MKHDQIVRGEAMAVDEASDVGDLLGARLVIDMQQDPQRALFNAYRVAFRNNANTPNLMNAAVLVTAWNGLADLMGLEPV